MLKIYIELGELSCVEKTALLFCFDVIAKDSVAAEAKLCFIDIPGKAWCEQCQTETMVQQVFAECISCGNWALKLISGLEFRIKELEVE